MSFADELRNIKANYNPEQKRQQEIEGHINRSIQTSINDIKKYCVSMAAKNSSISGYIRTDCCDGEHRFELVDKSEFKVKTGKFYNPPDNFGVVRGQRVEYESNLGKDIIKSSSESRWLADSIKNGILSGLYDCGFQELIADVVLYPKYVWGTNSHKRYKRIWSESIYAIYISIKW